MSSIMLCVCRQATSRQRFLDLESGMHARRSPFRTLIDIADLGFADQNKIAYK